MTQESERDLTLTIKLKNYELGAVALLFGGLQVFKFNFVPIVTIALLINLPLILISTELFSILKEQSGLEYLSIHLQIIVLIFQIPAWIAVSTITERYVLDGRVNPILALRRGFSKWRDVLWRRNSGRKINWESFIGLAFFLVANYFASLFPLNLPFLIVGYIFLVRTFFSFEAMYLRDLNEEDAYAYSKSIVQGRWKKIFFIIVVLALNNFLLEFILGVSIGIAIQLIPTIKSIGYVIANLIDALLSYNWFIVGTLLFLNLEYRKN